MDLAAALLWYVALLFSLCCHEAAHAWAAHRGGDPTAYLGGQVTLDPRPHIRREPFGTVVVPLLSFSAAGWMIGWASTPYDPHWAARHPRRAAWMALAGPAANAALVLAAAIAIRVGLAAGVFAPARLGIASRSRSCSGADGGAAATLAALISVLFTLNLLLLVFNLIPLPPLDGAVRARRCSCPSGSGAAAAAWRSRGRPGASSGLLVAWLTIRGSSRPCTARRSRCSISDFG